MRGQVAVLVLGACAAPDAPIAPPATPIGYDAYRHLDALPLIHIGDRAYMRSTYDRTGGNEGADASHYVRTEPDGLHTALDVAGPGVLVFTRANRWHGSPWHHVVDGDDRVIAESATANPDLAAPGGTFLPAAALPSPLAVTWSTTNGADLDWVPQPFARSLRISDERTHYGTGYFIYHAYPQGTPIAPWDESPPPDDVIALFASSGSDIAPPGDEHDATLDVPAGGSVEALELPGPATIRRLAIDVPADAAVALADVHLTIDWDNRALPSVDAPIGLLFAGGSLYNRAQLPVLVGGLLANVELVGSRVQLAMYFPMPFHASARIALVGAGAPIADVHVSARTLADAVPAALEGYFHATFVDQQPIAGSDLVLLDTTAAEGGGAWCGAFVGTSFTFSDRADFDTLEGDPRFFFDDARSPQGYGTGTEEWGGGGDYWGLQTVTLPLAGHPTGASDLASAQNAADAVESAYRFLVADAMPFGANARIQLEHGGVDTSTEHYRTVAYWYGRPKACLLRTDTLQIGDPDDEAGHHYASPTATDATSITSAWDAYGPTSPVETATARAMTGTTSFRVALDPTNLGVLLRRTLDYAVADQRAEVFVADDRDGAPFVSVGTWYLAGSTTCVYSNPPGELDPATDVLETVDRRWRDDEFLVPATATAGRAAIRIEIRTDAVWTESRYDVYSYVL